MSWTAERIERLKDLWPDNRISAADIARTLNEEFPDKTAVITRNAVIGKALRLKLPFRRGSTPPMNGASTSRARRNGDTTVFFRRPKPAAPNGHPIELPAFPFRGGDQVAHNGHAVERECDDAPSVVNFDEAIEAADSCRSRPCTLLELTADTCRWPIGDPQRSDFFFCGAVPAHGQPYCGHHCRQAYN
jgi:GcrA cell cycle regulator